MTEPNRTSKVKKVTKGTEHCGGQNVLHGHPTAGELKRANSSVPTRLCLPATMLPRGGSCSPGMVGPFLENSRLRMGNVNDP